jgi:hypothetical protein
MKNTYLYIKQHSVTGLKYFGKTTKDDPVQYLGSGKYWKRHIKKHGEEFVETIWYELFTSVDSLVKYAKEFSCENNIVESDEWANLKLENGLDGGMEKGWWTEEQLENNRQKAKDRHSNGVYDYEKLRLSRIGFKQPDSQKISVAKALSKEWTITSPTGQKQVITNLNQFCRDNKLDQGNLSRGSYKGWKCKKVVI